MIKNYFKTAYRNLLKYKTYSLINMFGLAIGMACTILILLWVYDELSFDNYHEDAERIFRIVHSDEGKPGMPFTPKILAAVLKKDFPQIEHVVRFSDKDSRSLIKYDNKKFYEDRIYSVDPEVFNVFNIPFIEGNPEIALTHPNTVVITEEIAQQYFGDENPTGKSLNIDNKNFEITGIIENNPHNTHIKFNFLKSIEPLKDIDFSKGWYDNAYYIYLKTNKNINVDEFENKINYVAAKYMRVELGDDFRGSGKQLFLLQPIKDIHLHSHHEHEPETPGNAIEIGSFSIISILILCLACLNYINLTTARSLTRVKEVGIRKVVGANKSQLVTQFLSESVLISVVAFLIALVLVELALPWFNTLTGKPFSVTCFIESSLIFCLIIILLFVGIFAGSYPTFFLSSSKSIVHVRDTRDSSLRKILVVCQFVISSLMIIGTLIIYQQLSYIKNKDLGFDKEQILVLPQGYHSMRLLNKNLESFKTELTNHHSIISATGTVSVPGRHMYGPGIRLIGEGDQKSYGMYFLHVDHDFIDTYNIGLIAGRTFQKDNISDKGNTFIINKAAVKTIGWSRSEEALGKRISSWGLEGEIIGICKNFHFQSLHESVGPMVLAIHPKIMPETLSLKLNTENLSETMNFIENKWNEFFPQCPFQYFFLDEYFSRQYHADEQFGKIMLIFAGLTIFIACLGLFGLASFTAEQRTREIGIRKVLGASVSGIVLLLSQEFIKWIIIANIIAWPITYFAINRWLQNFAYRINIGWWTFLLAGAFALAIALLTASYQVIKAAMANPVEALRNE